MKPDDPVCLCFHVTRRKVVNFIRVEKPRRASQLSECFGAGTGCGWCRPYLERILDAENRASSQGHDPRPSSHDDSKENVDFWESFSSEDYIRGRANYVRDGGGTPPPGATPIEPDSPDEIL
jgi:bacterioferritin-associated ferredoxin